MALNIFVSMLKILREHSNRWTQCNHYASQVVVYALAEKLLLFLLYLPLCFKQLVKSCLYIGFVNTLYFNILRIGIKSIAT